MSAQIFHDGEADRTFRAKWWTGRVAIYAVLILWAVDLPLPDLLDAHDLVQDGAGRDAGAT